MKRSFPVLLTIIFVLLSACAPTEPENTPVPTETNTPGPSATLKPSETPPAPTETLVPSDTPEPTPTQMPVEVLRSLPYAEDSPRQKLDVYLPTIGEAPYPTILAIHGGGFYARSKATYSTIGQYYARQGYAFISIGYRLTPHDSYPAQVADSFCALAWLHANHEEYGFDPNRVVVWGGSSGGYLAAMVGTVDDPDIYLEDCPYDYPTEQAVQAAVIFYGFYDFTNIDDYPAAAVRNVLIPFWGAEYEDIPAQKLEEMSPIKHIDGSDPPFILLHGTADTAVPSVMSERFADALMQAGVDVELVLLPDVGHAFESTPLTGEEMSLSLSKIKAFLDRVLAP